MTALELQDVSKLYGEGPTEVHALRDVSLRVDVGELVAVMGPSGSGKSTLLTIAGSLEEPSTGEVLVGGMPLSTMSRNDRARLRRRSIGYVFQDFNLLPGLTAAENVALPLELDGVPARVGPGPRAWPPWRSSAWSNGPHAFPTSSPAASANGSPSLEPWSATGTCSSPTSRQGRWTRPTARPSCG